MTDYEYFCPLPDQSDRRERCNGSLNVTVNDGKVLMRCRRQSCSARSGWMLELAYVLDAVSIEDVKSNFASYLKRYERRSYRRRGAVGLDAVLTPGLIERAHERLFDSPALLSYLTGPQRGFTEATIAENQIGYVLADELRGVWASKHPAYVFPIDNGTGPKNLFRRFVPGREPRTLRFDAAGARPVKWSGLGVQASLYPVPPSSDRVLICEGLADALVARQHGFDAVTATNGAAVKWRDEWLPHVQGAMCAVVYDPGAMPSAVKLAAFLREHGARDAWPVDLGTLAGLAPDEDVTVYFSRGGTAEGLRAIANAGHRSSRRQTRGRR